MIYLLQEDSASLKITEKINSMILRNTVTKKRVDLVLEPQDRIGGYWNYEVSTVDLEPGEWEYDGYFSGSLEARGILVIEGTGSVQYRGTYTDLNVIQYDGKC